MCKFISDNRIIHEENVEIVEKKIKVSHNSTIQRQSLDILIYIISALFIYKWKLYLFVSKLDKYFIFF